MAGPPKPPLKSWVIPVPIRLAGLWASAMFCYVYGDLIGFYIPGRIFEVAEGDLGPLGTAKPGLLAGIAVAMAIPALMIALSLHLPPRANRLANIVLGVAYTLMMLGTLFTAPVYYVVLGLIEMALTGTIAWQAWHWPRADEPPA